LLAAEEVVVEGNLPDVEADRADDLEGGVAGFAGASDDLRVGAGTDDAAFNGLGGMVAFEDGAEADTRDLFAGGLDEGADLTVEEA